MNNNFEYPEDYKSYLNDLEDNEIFSDAGFIELFPIIELEKINEEYQTESFVPNFIAIGTNGGGVGIFINKNTKQIYSIPLVGMEEDDAILLANSFTEFIDKFENNEIEIY